jgi:tetraacyldisaccharide 4'-kinase
LSAEARLQHVWYSRSAASQALRPLAWFYCGVVLLRRGLYRLHLLRTRRLTVPVIVVGNLTVGGTGKTPLVIAIVKCLQHAGYRPGIISRGYGGKAHSWPQQVRPDSDPVMVGDEPILIARHTGCPMAVGPDRVAAGRSLLQHADCDILVCDDGLQHYALWRDVEILVVDGVRRFGNGFCLPAGPLREPTRRKEQVDFIVTNGTAINREYSMSYLGDTLINLARPEISRPLTDLVEQRVHAVAGIGNPTRFFSTLRRARLYVEPHAFADHYAYQPSDLDFGDGAPVIMTEKDAVKCQRFVQDNFWYLPIEAQLNAEFETRLLNRITT